MERCTAVVLPAGRTSKKKHDPSFVDKCSEVTLPARAAAVRAVARYTAPFLGACGVQMASEEPSFEPQRIQRPARHEEAQNTTQPPVPEPEAEEEDSVSVRVAVSKSTGLPQADFMGTADPYVEFMVVSGDPLDPQKFPPKQVQKGHDSKAVDAKTIFKAKTKIIRGSLNPVWDDSWIFDVPNSELAGDLFLYFRLYDYDVVKSDDFMAHSSVRLMEALIASRVLTSGWRALLRCCPAICDRLDLLKDERLKPRPLPSYRLQHVPGEEQAYDLSAAELFIDIDLPRKPIVRSKLGVITRPKSPRTLAEKEAAQRDLLRASLNGMVPLARAAIAAGAAVNGTVANGTFRGCSPLHIACLKHFTDLAMALVDVFDASLVQRAPGGRSPAMCACEGGDEALAEWLIAEGVPVDLRDDIGRTVLHYAAKAALPQLTSWLIGKQQQPPGERAKDGSTPLMSAASSSSEANVVLVQQLLDARANASAKNKTGQTALHVACKAADDRCARLLLKLGARADILDADGRTALDLGRSSGMPTVMIARLRNLGADVEEGVGVGTQRHGETAEEARKREMRARKDEVSAAQNWNTWREAHPRRGLTPDKSTGEYPTLARRVDMKDDAYLPATPRSGQDSYINVYDTRNVPMFIGSLGSSSSSAPNSSDPRARSGKIARLKSWAGSLRSDRGRSKTPPPPLARVQSARSSRDILQNWDPNDSNTWAPSDDFK